MGKKGIKQGRGSILTTTRYLKQGGMLCVGRHQEKDAWLCFVPAALGDSSGALPFVRAGHGG